MADNIALNRETGEILVLSPEGQWQPAQRARNPQTGAEVFYNGRDWGPVPAPERGVGETVANVAGQFGAGFNRQAANVLGAVPNLYDAGLQAVGLPRLFGNEQRTASERLLGGINSLIGTPPEPQTTAEHLARGAGSGLVDAATVVLPAAAVARGSQVAGQAPSLVNRAATALAAQPGLQVASGMAGGAVADATDSQLAGVAAGLATPLAAAAGARVLTPVRTNVPPARAALVQTAEQEGIRIPAGQATGNRFLQNVESQLEQLPLTGDRQRALRETQETAFTRAVWRRAGENADDVLPTTITRARDRIGQQIGTISNRNTLRFTPQLDAELTQIEDSLRFIPAEAAGPVRARIAQLRGMVIQPAPPPGSVVPPGGAPMPTIPGASYRMMDSQLGRSIRSTDNGDLRAALGDLRERLRLAMDASISPRDAADWARARREYANLMVIANAAGRAGAGAAEGRLSPLALRQAVDQSTGGGYAFGRGDLNQLARIGQSVMRPSPDSGTAGRNVANGILTGSLAATGGASGAAVAGPVGAAAGAAGSLLTPLLIQALMNNPAGQAYLRNQLVQNPVLTRSLAAALAAQQGAGYAVSPGP